ncbi:MULTISPECIES: DUF6505 family protein [Marinobacter]|jgi:hypothetical protein|uniref:Uncharacterized protein n=1 Tax=Marinobacter salarius TaxID=1420917 RepID=W5YRZ0_9GAMM|nr:MULTISPECIES: DUF6505 family protein [Marinobacter]AHI31982.1 hypothetical protein AU15_14055 [Marinobacter salarius]MBE97195.1 hypothetical protein [Marinobacter sp.]PHQ74219.1 MAG: hypothetical protein COB82_05550 [Marinobacter sp.]WOI19524.1 DUF6505 family protein [Marinobacter salarius]|tara:strand:+ start:37 stop:513 length:477 start_codon:yes stop_codon:yes gene_type:complete
MKLARILRLDVSDDNVFDVPAPSGEWAISGGFEFSNWTEADLKGKARQAFSNGWYSIESGGRATFVGVCDITDAELEQLRQVLAQTFVECYGAPGIDAAYPVACEEIDQMRSMCEDFEDNTLLMVSRTLTELGVEETYRSRAPQDASLEAFAVHGSVD